MLSFIGDFWGDFWGELWASMRARKRFWMLPIIVAMALFGGLILLTEASAAAPFIYTIY